MNRLMWANAATQANVAQLRERASTCSAPARAARPAARSAKAACSSRRRSPNGIWRIFPANGPLAGKRVLITAGPTRERIDPVRFISNRSSGKMGYAVAAAMRELGAEVTLVSGPVNLPTPPGVQRIDVETRRADASAP